ncbi:MAG: hypothetical protein JSS63_02455 [Bacteroidetes bacterium]|nr:hypothetical protein [Bacteroidota bacterium]
MQNWKTSIGGLLMAMGTALVSSNGRALQSAGYICLGLGGLITGISAADAGKN